MSSHDERNADRRILIGPRLEITCFPQRGESTGKCRGMFPIASLQIQSFGNHSQRLDREVASQIISPATSQRLRLAIELGGLLQDRAQRLSIARWRPPWFRLTGIFNLYRSQTPNAGDLCLRLLLRWSVNAGFILCDGPYVVALVGGKTSRHFAASGNHCRGDRRNAF